MKLTPNRLVIYTLTLILFCQPVAVLSQIGASSLCVTVTSTLGALFPRAKVVATLKDAPAAGGPRVFETETNEEGDWNR